MKAKFVLGELTASGVVFSRKYLRAKLIFPSSTNKAARQSRALFSGFRERVSHFQSANT